MLIQKIEIALLRRISSLEHSLHTATDCGPLIRDSRMRTKIALRHSFCCWSLIFSCLLDIASKYIAYRVKHGGKFRHLNVCIVNRYIFVICLNRRRLSVIIGIGKTILRYRLTSCSFISYLLFKTICFISFAETRVSFAFRLRYLIIFHLS
jgi:hypothetical protein